MRIRERLDHYIEDSNYTAMVFASEVTMFYTSRDIVHYIIVKAKLAVDSEPNGIYNLPAYLDEIAKAIEAVIESEKHMIPGLV